MDHPEDEDGKLRGPCKVTKGNNLDNQEDKVVRSRE